MAKKSASTKCVCRYCNKEFYKTQYKISKGEGKYCSSKCYYPSKVGKMPNRTYPKRVGRVCNACGKAFSVTPSRIRKNAGKYCSKSCQSSSFKGRRAGAWLQKKCKTCGKLFTVQRYRHEMAMFCSKKCHYGLNPKYRIKCKVCGKIFLASEARIKENRGKYCSRACFNMIVKELRSTPENKERSRQRILNLYEIGKFPLKADTKPERLIRQELLRRGYIEGVDFKRQYKFHNRYICDFAFVNDKVIVECDGDYWHVNPDKFVGKILGAKEIALRNKSDTKTTYIVKADNYSWILLRYWESDIKKDVKGCVDKIEAVLRASRR